MLAKIKAFFVKFFAYMQTPTKVEQPKPVEEKPGQVLNPMPWRQWFVDRLGWNEGNPANCAALEKGWKYTNVPGYRGIKGRDRAWCAMAVCTALEENGYKSSRDAAAASYDDYGTPINFKKDGIPKGAIVTIRHASGGRHVTTANRNHAPGERWLEGLGGNQMDSIRVSTYDVSGNDNGHDQIVAVRWPVKKSV